jgi:CHAD domain-containing protein
MAHDARTPLAEVAPARLRGALGDVRRQKEKVRGGRSHDAVHDMRVACRRLRAALALFGGRSSALLAREVQSLQDALGGVRDHHVQRAWLKDAQVAQLMAAQDAEHAEKVARLESELDAFEERTAPALARAIEEDGFRGRLFGGRVRERLRKKLGKLRARLRDAKSLEPAPAHAARIAAKKLRYQLELVKPALPGRAADAIEGLQELQDALGQLHDADARCALLTGFVERAAAVEGAGELDADLPQALSALAETCAGRDELAKEARRALHHFSRSDALHALRASLKD